VTYIEYSPGHHIPRSCDCVHVCTVRASTNRSRPLAMSSNDPSLHPGVICAIVLLPFVTILAFTFAILKGFNLLPSAGWWRPSRWSSRRPDLPEQHLNAQRSTITINSYSTDESNFVGQRRDGVAAIAVDPRLVECTLHPSGWRREFRVPAATSHHQKETV
jgi:hypothetical protein